jgi:hypothetical protein
VKMYGRMARCGVGNPVGSSLNPRRNVAHNTALRS